MPTVSRTEPVDEDIRDHIEDMIRDLGQDCFQQAHAPLYDKIESDSKKPLYSGCTSFTRLSAVLALVNLKVRFGWSDKSFTEFLVILKKMLPEQNALLKNHYKEKKILCTVGMEYQKIHACPNDCILYKNQFAEMRKCPTCGVSWYKINDDKFSDDASKNNSRPAKVCWYLPIIPRFKGLFANGHDAKTLTWHADGKKVMDCSDIWLILLNGRQLIISYGNLSGYSVKGHHACPICEGNMSFIQLKHGNKIVYVKHRRFLKPYHPYQQLKETFNGSQENESALQPLAGNEFYDRVKDIITIFGKTQKKTSS
ncbi:uncharacterized protein LOC114411259 [Glycine soja]|uniref:uncharacterized protein n=1 Tax=Glycine max TaxID=3847 RepID=UPI000E21B9B9|nr:uncharacterized protein LOC113001671 [Glycine max]XP_028230796.1 uncharacterized protein LOC114411259 [Glycine soja]|eukprot:XP_025984354.1 uncharacterized protein LOC113001671 [Glycine max]